MNPNPKSIEIDEGKIVYQAVRSSGPGGQHVNKTSTAIVLKYDVTIHAYPVWFLTQLKTNAGSLLSKDGVLTIKAQSFRSQSRNKDDVLTRLIDLFKQSAFRPKMRRKTKPPKRANENRLIGKKRQSEKKNLRKPPKLDE